MKKHKQAKRETKTKTQRKDLSLFFIKIYIFLNEFDLTIADKIIYGFIDNACRNNKRWHYCSMSDQDFIDYSGLSERQLHYSLNKLTKNNLISIETINNKRKITLINQNNYDTSIFIKMYTSVIIDSSLNLNDKLIYSIIRNLCNNPQKSCKLNAEDVCKICSSSIRNYYNSISKLITFSYIRIKEKHNTKHSNQFYKNIKTIFILKDLWPQK